MLKGNDYRNFIENLMVPHFEVSVKNLGVIGAGSIGNQVTKVVRALGMNILVYTKTPRRWRDRDIWPVSLMELLKRIDFVSIHIPLTSEAKYLINKDNLRVIKSYSFIIKEAASNRSFAKQNNPRCST